MAGNWCLEPTNTRNNKGCIVKAQNIAENIPIMQTKAILYNAGCLAKINTPMPNMVVITESVIEVL